jgi:rhamnose utilization protein RhaD (predicted bifunctional aldolase and dehydrogenase)
MAESDETRNGILDSLARMSRSLGNNTDYVILAEGNTSARSDDRSFFVKASGKCLREIDACDFVEVLFQPLIQLLHDTTEGDEAVITVLNSAKVKKNTPLRPSIETLSHAYLLTLPDIRFIAHLHTTSINSLMCSQRSRDIYNGRIFPDEIVVCGPEPVVVPYRDPGLLLSRELMNTVSAYQQKWNEAPKLILMENHGMIALGTTTREVEAICAMADKTARVLLGTLAAGGPRYINTEDVERIATRPDELMRQKQISRRDG